LACKPSLYGIKMNYKSGKFSKIFFRYMWSWYNKHYVEMLWICLNRIIILFQKSLNKGIRKYEYITRTRGVGWFWLVKLYIFYTSYILPRHTIRGIYHRLSEIVTLVLVLSLMLFVIVLVMIVIVCHSHPRWRKIIQYISHKFVRVNYSVYAVC